jgi:hypothetical protein
MSASSSTANPSLASSFADRFDDADDLLAAWADGLRQDPDLTVS